MSIPILNEQDIIKNITHQKNPFFTEYYAFYSSWFKGIVKNPHWMLLPIDDHMAHRGDGVFESLKAIDQHIYLLDEHLTRLFKSAEAINITPPVDFEEMKRIVITTIQAAEQNDATIRMYVSRGPGNFSVNPYDSVGAQLYIAITKFSCPSEEKYTKGVTVGKSDIAMKDNWLARVKSCNYLPNVMMKKEAVDRKLDFTIGVNDQGYITEGATENIMIIDQQGILAYPLLCDILPGTTLMRICELAEENNLKTEMRLISLQELQHANEVWITGTSLDVLPVATFEGQNIADGKPGPLAKKFLALMQEDVKKGPKRTSWGRISAACR